MAEEDLVVQLEKKMSSKTLNLVCSNPIPDPIALRDSGVKVEHHTSSTPWEPMQSFRVDLLTPC